MMLKRISPTDPRLTYCGRIDFAQEEEPLFVYPCSYVRFLTNSFTGRVVIVNCHSYYENAIGILVDGEYRGRFPLADQGETSIDFSECLDGGEHEITLFKLMDGCHYYRFLKLWIDVNARLEKAAEYTDRRIEVYGDSVSAGEVSEAVDRVGMPDPENHNGRFSNSFYSYSWMLGRKLNARVHAIAQGGIALLNGEGYYDEPDYRGMEWVFDKISYNERLAPVRNWKFESYIPQVVMIALGQNDAHPVNYMQEDYEGQKARHWRAQYTKFVSTLMEKYPKAHFILCTTILCHAEAWDKAIEQVTEEIHSPRVHHFLYSENGKGTVGHIRIPEADKMAEELASYIARLPIEW